MNIRISPAAARLHAIDAPALAAVAPAEERLPGQSLPGLKLGRRALLAGISALALPIMVAAPQAQAQAANTPVAVIDAFDAKLLMVMQQAKQLGLQGRYRELQPAMEQVFDLAAMTRISVGPRWSSMTPAQQQGLVTAFSNWSIATYANRFDGYSNESFQTLGSTELPNGDALVRTQLLRPSDDPVAINYLMRQNAGVWRVVDVYLSGTISELASRRSEFSGVLRDGGPEQLEAELKKRTASLMQG